jgi:hypothetical protein
VPAGDGAWQDRSGDPWSVRHAIEQAAGQRLGRDGVFETGQARPELAEPVRRNVVVDQDGIKTPLALPARVREAAEPAGLFTPDPAVARDRAVSRQLDHLSAALLGRPRSVGWVGDGPTFAERREALRSPVILAEVQDMSLPGAPAVRAYGRAR